MTSDITHCKTHSTQTYTFVVNYNECKHWKVEGEWKRARSPIKIKVPTTFGTKRVTVQYVSDTKLKSEVTNWRSWKM